MTQLALPENAQSAFLYKLHATQTTVTLFLTNGVKLQGTITGYDDFAIVLSRSSQTQLVYKHAIATIVPA